MRYGLPSWMSVKTTNCTSPLLAFKNFTRAHLFQIALEIIMDNIHEIMCLPVKILDAI